MIKAVVKSDLKDKELSSALSKLQIEFFESFIPNDSIPEKGLTLSGTKGAVPVESVLRTKTGKVKYAGWLKTRLAWKACSQLNLHTKKLRMEL